MVRKLGLSFLFLFGLLIVAESADGTYRGQLRLTSDTESASGATYCVASGTQVAFE